METSSVSSEILVAESAVVRVRVVRVAHLGDVERLVGDTRS